ncbi:uncharacterized protein VP01_510g4 [Puccinia sorghi]|uniref:HAT C-terminal dimerisation domain-containing protein n=1 Tax=Puccinia sorghi TaxID=27349 RepID=A0A0L6ULW3_9BASI|nr:uncharacterized protein VP01_510g4 [Puccinia sorghi]
MCLKFNVLKKTDMIIFKEGSTLIQHKWYTYVIKKNNYFQNTSHSLQVIHTGLIQPKFNTFQTKPMGTPLQCNFPGKCQKWSPGGRKSNWEELLNKALPIYFVLMKHSKQAQHKICNQAQLIAPSEEFLAEWLMIGIPTPATLILDKIQGYLNDTLKKPIYFYEMILKPEFKIILWKKNKAFILEYFHISHKKILQAFFEATDEFNCAMTTENKEPDYQPQQQHPLQQPPIKTSDFPFCISMTPNWSPSNPRSEEWSNQIIKYPVLLKMACFLLAIPATSVVSKRVFSQGKCIISSKRSYFKTQTDEELLCMKNFEIYSHMLVASYASTKPISSASLPLLFSFLFPH